MSKFNIFKLKSDQKISKQNFVPGKVHTDVESTVALLQVEFDELEKSKSQLNKERRMRKNSLQKTIQYLTRLVSDKELEVFYLENSEIDFLQSNFLDEVIEHFKNLATWENSNRNTFSANKKISARFISHVKKAKLLLLESQEFEGYLSEGFGEVLDYNSPPREITTPHLASVHEPRAKIWCLLNDLEEIALQFSEAASNKKNIVSKFEKKDAKVQYSVRKLKRIFLDFEVPIEFHTEYISLLINSALNEDLVKEDVRRFEVVPNNETVT